MLTNETKTSQKIIDYYDFVFKDLADSRTNDWFLIKHPGHGLSILLFYLYFVNSWGPKLMKHRDPWKLTKTLLVYNFIQVIISVYIFVEGLDAAWLHYSWKCEPCDHSNTPEALRVARVVYVYFIAKITELLDTAFFVLRKKDNQITFLHLYHHTMMPVAGWIAVKYYPGGHCTLIGVVNSFVHIIMYTYYLLAALGPEYQKFLWWKRYITTMQLAQFCLAFLHNSQVLFTDCGYPKWPVLITLPNCIFFYYLFSDFYKMAYGKTEDKKKLHQENDNGELNDDTDKSNILSNSVSNKINGTTYRNKSE